MNRLIKWVSLLWQTILSIIKVLLQSKWFTKLPLKLNQSDELIILANGPSLNKTIDESGEFLIGKTLLVVNFFVNSPRFTQLRPELYLIADPLFWLVPEKCQQLFGGLANKTDWPMILFIPHRASKYKEWKDLLSKNPHIKIVIYNTTPIEGFQCFCNWVFNRGWGMPRPHNVLIPSIVMGLRIHFKKIYLAGADHSWLPEIKVTDDNVVLMHQKHFYDQKTSKPDTVKQENLQPSRIHTIMYHMYVAFKSYHILEAYAKYLGRDVINITPGSYIDAFKRLKI